jgi:hypothetical protein
MPAPGPAKCPVCNYDLRGLPIPHRCPECGSEYDEHTRVWRPRGPWAQFVADLVVATIALPATIGVLFRAATRGWSFREGVTDTIIWPVVLVLCAYPVIRVYVANRRGRCVALTPGGVFVRTAELEKLIPWRTIEKVIRKGRTLSIKIRAGDGTVDIEKIFPDEKELESFLAAYQAAHHRSAQPAGADAASRPADGAD